MEPIPGGPPTTSGVTTRRQMEHRNGEFGERLVSVRAIVMAWDDRYSGWQPLEGGGLTNVVLYQRLRSVGEVGEVGVGTEEGPGPSHAPLVATPSAPSYEYTIRGERLEDGEVTIHCRVTKDINYRQVMPTFHHWQVGDMKYGLVFTSTYEGSKFHNRLQKAIEHLYQQSKSSSGGSNGETEDLDDDVFVPVELPLSRAESWESGVTTRSMPAEASSSLLRPPLGTTVVPAIVHPPPWPFQSKKKSAISAIGVPSEFAPGPSSAGRTPTWPKTPASAVSSKTSTASAAPFPYAYYQKEPSSATVFMKPPPLGLHRPASTGGLQASTSHQSFAGQPQPSRSVSLARPTGLEKRESTSSLKIPLIHHLPPPPAVVSQRERRGRFSRSSIGRASPTPASMLRRERCFYCKALYSEQENRRGACPNAPDACWKWIRKSTCIWCAECTVMRCCQEWNDGEVVTESDVCSCSPDVPMRTLRWAILAALALLVPCLCLYPPLLLCYRGCRSRGWTGGRHRPSGSTQSSGSGGRSSSAARMSTPEASSGHYR